MSTPGVRRPRPAKPEGFVEPHDHTAPDKGGVLGIASIPTESLGSGADGLGAKFLRDDRTWAPAGGGGGSSTSPVSSPFVHVAADAGLGGLVAGDPVSTWPDQSGNGRDFVGSGSSRPTFRANDLGDGKPFVEFDGSNDGMLMSGSPAFGHPNLTLHGVVRFRDIGVTFAGILSLSEANTSDANSTGRMALEVIPSNHKISITRNGQSIAGPYSINDSEREGWNWGIVTVSTRSAMGLGVASFSWLPKWTTERDFGSPIANWTFTHIGLGARFFNGALTFWSRCDWRELLIYDRSLSGLDQVNNVKYLAAKWGIPGV